MISTLFSSLNINPNIDFSASPAASSSSASFAGAAQPQPAQMQPVLVVIQKTMPILKKVGEVFMEDEAIVKGLCSALKYAMVNLVNDFTPMLPDVSVLILQIFNSAKYCSPAMDIARIVSLNLFYIFLLQFFVSL